MNTIKFCLKCGHPVGPEEKFCMGCGANIAEMQAQQGAGNVGADQPTQAPQQAAASVDHAQVQQTAPPPVQQPAAQPAPPKPAPAASEPLDIGDIGEFESLDGIPDGIPPALADLMRQNNVTESEIQLAVGMRGYFPENMPIANYPPDFIQGVLIGAWAQVFGMIQENRKLPFE